MTKWLNDFYCFFIRWPCKSTTSSTIITSTAIHTLLLIHTILTYTDTCIQTYNNNAYRQHTVRCIHWRTIFIFSPVIPYIRSAPSLGPCCLRYSQRWCSPGQLGTRPPLILVVLANVLIQCYNIWRKVWQICPCFRHFVVCVCIYVCSCLWIFLGLICVCVCVCVQPYSLPVPIKLVSYLLILV